MANARIRYWAGFSEGVIHIRLVDTGFGGRGNGFTLQPAIFTSRRQARREYEDVREVFISEEENAP